jgi:hypothetical protein
MPGTGLGMSIVKQLVDLAEGTIDVSSEFGKGTQVKLRLPLENHLSESADDTITPISPSETSEDLILAVRRRAQGRTITLRGFDSPSGTTYLQSQSLASLKASIQKYIRQWFNLHLVSTESGNYAAADIIVSDESAFLDSANLVGNELLSHGQAQLILCSNVARHSIYAASIDSNSIIEFISKPCGPRRLAKALLNCLDKETINKGDVRYLRLRDLDASAPKRRPKSSAGDTLYEADRSGDIGTAENAGKTIDLQSSVESSSPAMSLSMTPGVYANRESKSADRSSPNQSSDSDTKRVSSSPASSGDKNGSGNTTPSS